MILRLFLIARHYFHVIYGERDMKIFSNWRVDPKNLSVFRKINPPPPE